MVIAVSDVLVRLSYLTRPFSKYKYSLTFDLDQFLINFKVGHSFWKGSTIAFNFTSLFVMTRPPFGYQQFDLLTCMWKTSIIAISCSTGAWVSRRLMIWNNLWLHILTSWKLGRNMSWYTSKLNRFYLSDCINFEGKNWIKFHYFTLILLMSSCF